MRLMREEQILEPEFRKHVLKEIRSAENVARKNEHLKRYEIYKDQTVKYVAEGLLKEGLLPETVQQMVQRAGNISFCRKIVNKLARAYSGGAARTATPSSAQGGCDDLTRLLRFDSKMKKADRYRELQRNTMLYVGHEVNSQQSAGGELKYDLKLAVLAPWQYDVIEDQYDREEAKVIIISQFTDQVVPAAASEQKAGVHGGRSSVTPITNKKDDTIADAPQDAGPQNEYVWWSTNYHFTTNEKGEIIHVGSKTPENNANPIGMLPFANNADEQDGQFWARGGSDLIDGSILLNKQITDMNYIAYLQGFGQPVITGKNVTRDRFRFGVNNAIVLDYDPSKDEPKPEIDIITASPPLDSWMKMIEQAVALLLTTNNLSPSNVSGRLDATTFPSGIAMLVEQSEATDDISDKQADYKDIERTLWEATKRWQNLLYKSGGLSVDFAKVGALPDQFEVTVKFNESKPVVTEAEKLANLEKRKELGLNTTVELLQLDNPDLTEEEAEQKMAMIAAERTISVTSTPPAAEPTPPAANDEEDDDETEDGDGDAD